MNKEVDHLGEMMSGIFALIEKELALLEGPVDGFNIFISFKKLGSLPKNLAVPEPLCVVCKGALVNRHISTKT